MKSEFYLLFLLCVFFSTSQANQNLMKTRQNVTDVKSKPAMVSEEKLKEREWYTANLKVCNIKTCKPKNGLCSDKTTCHCRRGFAHVPELTKDTSCTYQQKYQSTTFFLEMFIMGAGHMYRGSVILGVMKLLFIVLFPFMFLALVFLGIIVESDIKSQTCFLISSIIISVFYLVTVLVWYLYDLINIGRNLYPDGNGVPLQSW